MLSPDKVSESEFYMWRAIFAFAFVDTSLSLEEQELLHSYLAKARLSPEQKKVLSEDLLDPKDVVEMYHHITETQHKERFCVLSRALAWCEGDMDAQEARILSKVSCLKDGEGHAILRRTRSEDHLHDFYKHYAKSGVIGLASYPHRLEMRM